jgi:hypothetical protein
VDNDEDLVQALHEFVYDKTHKLITLVISSLTAINYNCTTRAFVPYTRTSNASQMVLHEGVPPSCETLAAFTRLSRRVNRPAVYGWVAWRLQRQPVSTGFSGPL